jgi:uncharacterized protein
MNNLDKTEVCKAHVLNYLREICEPLLDSPENLEIEMCSDDSKTLFILKLQNAEVGKLIGERGRLANSIRYIIKSYATKLKCGNVYMTVVDKDAELFEA